MTEPIKPSTPKIEFINKLPQHEQKTDAWLEQRQGRLTSSDAGTVLGLNPYEKDTNGVLFRKCGKGAKFTGNVATKHGEKYETEAIDLYSKLLNKTNHEFGLIDYDAMNPIRKPSKLDSIKDIMHFIAGSPDGVAVDNDGTEDEILIEVKCPMRRKIKFGYCPEYYYPQVQLNMAIFDLYKADFIEYIPKGISPFYLKEPMINIVRIHRDDDWLIKNIQIMHAFWNTVLYWRIQGIENNPDYVKYLEKEGKREIRAETRAINKKNSETKKIQDLFREEAEEAENSDDGKKIEIMFRDDE